MKQLITFTIVLFLAMSSLAQSDSSHYTYKNKQSFTSLNRFHTTVSMGAGVNFLNSGPASTITFISPSLDYHLTKKLALNVGLIHYNVTGNTFITNKNRENALLNNNNTTTGNIIQIGGAYLLNEHIALSGSVLYNVTPSFNNKQNNFTATSLGLDYKINPNTTISIHTNISRGNSLLPIYYDTPLATNPAPFSIIPQRGFNSHSTGVFSY